MTLDVRQWLKERGFERYAELFEANERLHWCIGAYIAEAQITQTFKPLLKRSGFRRSAGDAGKMHRLSVFPVHLWVEFDA